MAVCKLCDRDHALTNNINDSIDQTTCFREASTSGRAVDFFLLFINTVNEDGKPFGNYEIGKRAFVGSNLPIRSLNIRNGLNILLS